MNPTDTTRTSPNGAITPSTACCDTAARATCCRPEAKADCCGQPAQPASCGCQAVPPATR